MKQLLTTVIVSGIVLLIGSCSKDAVTGKTPAQAIIGKWDIVSDESFSGIGQNNHPVNYTGQAGDYFDFRADGKLYTKEAAVSDTLAFKFTSDSTIIISAFGIALNGVPEICNIENLTTHTLTLHAAAVITPGGVFGRKAVLRR